MLTASVENMLVTSIGRTLEIGVYQRSTSLSFRLSADSIQRWNDVGPIINFCLDY